MEYSEDEINLLFVNEDSLIEKNLFFECDLLFENFEETPDDFKLQIFEVFLNNELNYIQLEITKYSDLFFYLTSKIDLEIFQEIIENYSSISDFKEFIYEIRELLIKFLNGDSPILIKFESNELFFIETSLESNILLFSIKFNQPNDEEIEQIVQKRFSNIKFESNNRDTIFNDFIFEIKKKYPLFLNKINQFIPKGIKIC